jgi:DNA segregation ATPase FtsK/SpoIIIE, S-DNA-T family
VATKQQARPKRSPAKRPAAKRAPAKRTAAKRPAARRSPWLGDALRQSFAGHGHDVAGLVLIVVGVVAGLGIYADGAGPVGQGLATGFGAVVGLACWILPPALVGLGVIVIRGRRVEAEPAAIVGPVVGGVLILAGVCGLAHLMRGRPAWGDPVSELGRAGGALGIVTAGSLARLIGPWAAGLVVAAVGVIGLLLVTRTSVRAAASATAGFVRPLTGTLGRAVRPLFEVGDRPDDTLDDQAGSGSIDLREEASTRLEPTGLTDLASGAAPAVLVAGDEPDAVELAEPEPEPLADQAADVVAIDAEGGAGRQLEIDLGPATKGTVWKLPSAKLLNRSSVQEVDRLAVEQRGRALEAALAEHGVETRLVGMVVGPTVTRYELELGPGVKVARVTSLHKDIAYAMASPDVRILAPIPGRQAIGVEVPNADRQVVAMGDILSSEEARRATHPLEVAVGRDINGRAVLANLATMPHVLIAGATGAGKSSCINSLITSVLMRSTPDQVRMILVDPKRVELGQYNKLPHLLTQVVTNPKKAANALSWAVREMERRYDLLSEVGVRDITGYNAAYDRGELTAPEGALGGDAVDYQRLPFILIVVDELNDLMMVAARDVEDSICRIAQMARAVGIHLVIATQRPSVNVITGVIKANVPARWAFSVSSLADSRVILDQPGAERLVGKGDMLLLGPASSVPQRIQGCWVDEKEVRAVVGSWIRQAPETRYVEGVEGSDDPSSGSVGGPSGSGGDDDDDLLTAAMELVVRSQLGSTSMLQRKLRVGFARAGRLMDLLEQRGVVGPGEGSKARAVLMTPDELDGEQG